MFFPDLLFPIGNVTFTDAVLQSGADVLPLLARHVSGDWGTICAEDAAANNTALKTGGRILSAYPIDESTPCNGSGDNCVWVITEADRSATRFLLPSEY